MLGGGGDMDFQRYVEIMRKRRGEQLAGGQGSVGQTAQAHQGMAEQAEGLMPQKEEKRFGPWAKIGGMF